VDPCGTKHVNIPQKSVPHSTATSHYVCKEENLLMNQNSDGT